MRTRTPAEDLIGRRFGKLVVMAKAPKSHKCHTHWDCRCDCGRTTHTRTYMLIYNRTTQCQSCNMRGTTRLQLPQGDAGFNEYFRSQIKSAKNRELPFTLTKDEVKEINKRHCHYCGKPPSQIRYGGWNSKGSLGRSRQHSAYLHNGLDRVDNSLGYTVENAVPCCGLCNWMKMTMTKDAFIAHLYKIIAYRSSK